MTKSSRFRLFRIPLTSLFGVSSFSAQATYAWQLADGGDWTVTAKSHTPSTTGDAVVFKDVDGTITNIITIAPTVTLGTPLAESGNLRCD